MQHVINGGSFGLTIIILFGTEFPAALFIASDMSWIILSIFLSLSIFSRVFDSEGCLLYCFCLNSF